ncbi:hypothetical protein MTR_1g064610 [Medicago truncatula]|uniref:Uncharacterized protein n=1 Tax=Medicago truncatula TaxID=3880 RepID=A0A072VJL9_MEDTR|nr:hypothetical protein MTR_1g064610 [Medicago truncatula]
MVAQCNENLSDLAGTEPLYGQGNIDMSCDSADILCQDNHQEEAILATIPLGGNSIVNDEIVDLDENTCQPFQLVVPRKKKLKKKQPEAGRGFKVGASSRSPH